MGKREQATEVPRARKKIKRSHAAQSNGSAEGADSVLAEELATDCFYVAAGSYERLLYGLEARLVSDKQGKRGLDLQPIFSFPAHVSCIKTLAFSPPTASSKTVLVTGGTDEAVKVWDVRRRKEVGSLVVHSGIITRVLFASAKHFVSASTDNTLALLHTKDWSVLRNFKGHKGRINDVAVHPQGRVALSVAADRTLRMWDLLGSKTSGPGSSKEASSSTKLGREGEVVRWNADGTRFAVIVGPELRVYQSDFTLMRTLKSKTRYQDMLFYDDTDRELLLVACEDGKILVYETSVWAKAKEVQPSPFAELVGHTRRVKALRAVDLQDANGESVSVVVSASSDGFIRFHDLSAVSQGASEAAIATYDTKGSRLICLDAVPFMATAKATNGTTHDSESSEAASDTQDSSEVEDGEDEFVGFGDDD